MKMYWC